MYNVHDLVAFATVIEKKGVSAAATALDLSPATVSHRISKLEKHFNEQLFHRDSRHFKPSPKGEALYHYVLKIIALVDEAEDVVGFDSDKLSGDISLTLPPWVFEKYIAPHLSGFLAKHPKLNIHFITSDEIASLVEDGIDAAIRVGQLEDSGLLAQRIAGGRRILCASPDYLQQHGTPENIADLASHHWVCLPWQRQWQLKSSANEITNIKGRNQITVSNSDSLTQSAINGLGIAMKSELAIRDYLTSGVLVEVLPNTIFNDSSPIWLVRAPQSARSKKLNVLFSFLKEIIPGESH